jgi:glutamate dehydrogenase/leucine dehydrogenase
VGIWHPQEGVFTGHFKPTEPQKVNRIGQLRRGVIKIIEDAGFTPSLAKKYTIADMCTGYGVAEAVKHYYQLWGGDLKGKRAVVQGWGNVGAAAGFYLSAMGVKIVGIIGKDGGILDADGFSHEKICALVVNRHGNKLVADNLIPTEALEKKVWDMEFEIFIPAAASRLITKEQVDRMISSKLEVFSCGANVPFADPEIFFGPTGLYADQKFSVIPDFIANCGMARVFAYFMESEVSMEDEAIFKDISTTIQKALAKSHQRNSEKTNIAQTSFEIALQQLV